MEYVQEKYLVRWSTSSINNDEQFYKLRLNDAETFKRFYARFEENISIAPVNMDSKQGVKSSNTVTSQVSLKDGPLTQQQSLLLKEKVDFDTVVLKQTEPNTTESQSGNLPVEPADDDDVSKANLHQESTKDKDAQKYVQQCYSSEEVDDSILPMASTQSNYTRDNFVIDCANSRDLMSDLQQVCIHINCVIISRQTENVVCMFNIMYIYIHVFIQIFEVLKFYEFESMSYPK